jgi:uncharacterized membrane protein YjgN (DUF898 family)
MSVGGRRLKWKGEFSEYYWQSLINLFYGIVTLGVHPLLGYGDLRIERYVDEHIDFDEMFTMAE